MIHDRPSSRPDPVCAEQGWMDHRCDCISRSDRALPHQYFHISLRREGIPLTSRIPSKVNPPSRSCLLAKPNNVAPANLYPAISPISPTPPRKTRDLSKSNSPPLVTDSGARAYSPPSVGRLRNLRPRLPHRSIRNNCANMAARSSGPLRPLQSISPYSWWFPRRTG